MPGRSIVTKSNRGGRRLGSGRKPMDAELGAMTPGERVRAYRERHALVPGDDFEERQAVDRALREVIELVKHELTTVDRGSVRPFVMGHKTGLDRAIAKIEQYRAMLREDLN
jgi:hypothetical protein